MQTKYINYIGERIDNVCPYEDANLRKIYHIGFMQAVLAELMLNDSKNLEIFKRIVKELENG